MRHGLARMAYLLLVAGLAFAADVSGTWKAEFETPDGTKRTNTFVLKQEGEKLSGTVAGGQDATQIEAGTVKGDTISFEAERPFGHFKYQGTVTGNEIKLKVSFNEQSFEMVAKKQP
jgi:hypothetical protein